MSAATDKPSLGQLSHDQQLVLTGFALGWKGKTRAWVLSLLDELGAVDSKGRHFSAEAVQVLIRGLAQSGWLVDLPQRLGQWQVEPDRRSAVFLAAIDRHGVAPLRKALAAVFRFDDSTPTAWTYFSEAEAAAGMNKQSN